MKIEIFSVIIAFLSALFAWRSIGVAKKQNKISSQIAYLESLLHKRSKLEEIRLDMALVQDRVQEKFKLTPEKLKQNKLSPEDAFILLKDCIYIQQKASNIIFCYHHYFNIDDISKLKNWIAEVENSESLIQFNSKASGNTILVHFNTEIIPKLLENLEIEITDLEQKIRTNAQ